MGLCADTRDEVQKELVTKIHGQPANQEITLLKRELIAITTMIPTTLGGGGHEHTGLIVENEKYLIMTHRAALVAPANPGIYPAGLAHNTAKGIQAREEALHKESVAQFKILARVKQALKDIIIRALESNNILEIVDKTHGV
jgi:hypothetical protein